MAKVKTGRPNKYETDVKPRFKEIKKWVQSGATDKEVQKNLGIAKSTYMKYKNMYKDFSDLLKENKKKPVEEIKAAMLKRAKGFSYKEEKVTYQYIDLPDELIQFLPENETKKYSRPKLVKVETTTKTALPDVAAGLVLLQHWDKDDDGKTKWSRDPANLEIKKEELEIKKQQAENDNW